MLIELHLLTLINYKMNGIVNMIMMSILMRKVVYHLL